MGGLVRSGRLADDALARPGADPHPPRAPHAAVITPRTTRLVRTADLQTFREAVVALACEGTPLDARDRLVVVPTRAAAAHLLRAIEDVALATAPARLLPDIVT